MAVLDRDTVLLSKFCDETNSFTLDDLPGRISFQKRVYLLQAAGIDLGYRFTWDLRGPYSRGLALAGEQLAREREAARELGKALTLRGSVEEKIRQARELMTAPDGVDEAAWVEFLASLHYLRTNDGIEDTENAFRRLVELKPHLANLSSAKADAWQRLDRLRITVNS